MVDFLVGPDRNWVIESGDVVLCRNASFIRQQWFIRVSKWQGEWLLDTEDGLRYKEIFEKRTIKRTQELLWDLTLNTPGVIAVEGVNIKEIDVAGRRVAFDVRARIEGPEDITFQYSGFIPAVESTCAANFPQLFDGLKVWVDSKDLKAVTMSGSASYLTNKAAAGSGSGTAEVVAASSINGHRALRFNGNVFDIMNDTPAIRHGDGSMTIFIVLRGDITSDGRFGVLTMNGVGDSVYQKIMLSMEVSGGVASLRVESYKFGEAAVVSTALWPGASTPELLTVRLLADSTLIVQSASGYIDMSIDLVPFRPLDGSYIIGGETDGGGVPDNKFSGDIGEILVYEGTLSTDAINSVTLCLSRKWGLTLGEIDRYGYGFFPVGLSPHGY